MPPPTRRPGPQLWLALSLTWATWGCESPCEDADGDGFGRHCEAGEDCDDDDETRAADCNRPPSDCEQDPEAEGCSCFGGTIECFDAPAEAAGVGACRVGEKRCITGRWGACNGVVLPAFDLCNGADDDCDGRVDERVQSPCGGCDTSCSGSVWGSDEAPFELAGELVFDDAGFLSLSRELREAESLWVANGGDRTLSLVDARGAVERARYRLDGQEPTRVVVDYPGDAWVLSPSRSGHSVLTHVAAARSDCASGDAAVTSTGPGDLLPLGGDDCVLLSARVGAAGEHATALAIDGQLGPDDLVGGHPWVGFSGSERIAELDPTTGAELSSVALPDLQPQVASFDLWGNLWVASADGLLAHVDLTAQPPAVEVTELPSDCFQLEDLVVDADGVIYLSGFSCEQVLRYDPATGSVLTRQTEDLRTTRGLGLLDDALFVAHTEGSLGTLSLQPFQFTGRAALADDDVEPFESIGVSTDSLGQVWVISAQHVGEDGLDEIGLATRYDPDAETVSAQLPVGRLPRALGDFTGSRMQGAFAEEGTTRAVFEGCVGGDGASEATEWLALHVRAVLGPGASVSLRARHAADVDALPDADFEPVGSLPEDSSPLPLALPEGGALELELTLRSGQRTGAPRIEAIGLEWGCPGPQ